MSKIKCLYCDTLNDATECAGYCDKCGKRLPEGALHHRDHPGPYDPARSAALASARKKTSTVLFVIAAVYLILGIGSVIILAYSNATTSSDSLAPAAGVIALLTLVFVALGIWARFNPLPPASIALAINVVVILFVIVVNAKSITAWNLVLLVLISICLGEAIRISWKAQRLA
jgi:hypothetical protein